MCWHRTNHTPSSSLCAATSCCAPLVLIWCGHLFLFTLADCDVASCHAAAFHRPAPLPFVMLMPLIILPIF